MRVKNSTAILALICSLTVTSGAFADQSEDEAAIRNALSGLDIDAIQPAPVDGLYEVRVGAQVVYVSADARYLMQGDLIDLKTRQSLTEPRRREAQRAAVESVGEDNMIIFKPKTVKHKITVFTDIECGYCRKLHRELDQYLDQGIEVRYLMYPRAGVGSSAYRKAVAVWCAEDRNSALTDAKAGKTIEMSTCENPVDEHMELARSLGLRGTPFIVLENGQVQPGYVPANKLAQLLDADDHP
jgi:thiol:disulfide interchange protein DsbC